MGKVGFQKNIYQGFIPPVPSRPAQTMERFLYRSQSPAPNTPAERAEVADSMASAPGTLPAGYLSQPQSPAEAVTVTVLDLKLQTLLQDLTRNITKEVGKLAQELRGEIDQLGERTATLETKFDETIQYMHALEEEYAYLKHTVSQIQLQQEDLENRERRSNIGSAGSLKLSAIRTCGYIY